MDATGHIPYRIHGPHQVCILPRDEGDDHKGYLSDKDKHVNDDVESLHGDNYGDIVTLAHELSLDIHFKESENGQSLLSPEEKLTEGPSPYNHVALVVFI